MHQFLIFLARKKIVDMSCFFYNDQCRHSCPKASCPVIQVSKKYCCTSTGKLLGSRGVQRCVYCRGLGLITKCPRGIKQGPLEGPGGRTLSGTIRGWPWGQKECFKLIEFFPQQPWGHWRVLGAQTPSETIRDHQGSTLRSKGTI